MKRLSLAILVLLPVLASSVLAQTLADVARKEEQRRKQVPKPAKVYTNKDLGQVPPPSPGVPGAAQPGTVAEPDAPAEPEAGAPAAGESKPAEGASSEAPEPTEEDQRASDAASWRGKIDGARAQLERSRMFAEALQTRINSLWADFTARDDPAQRARIGAERQKALDELDRVKKDIEAQTKAIADIEEQARRAGVQPGLLR